MTREEAIADIRDNIKPVIGGKSLDMAIKALERTGWILCSERLPDIPDGEDWVRCLCYGEKEITPDHVNDSSTITCIEIVTYFRRYGWDGCFHPIAWMPLPEVYKAESEEEDENI